MGNLGARMLGDKKLLRNRAKYRLSRNSDDPQQPTHTEAPIMMGFSVVSARSDTLTIESEEEPKYRRT